MKIALVVAVAENGVIGLEGGLPWHVSGDLRTFRRLTLGKPVIMGRKTFQSIGKPLDGRTNIVVTRDPDFHAEGILAVRDITTALELALRDAQQSGTTEVMVIGGAQIYDATLPHANRVYLTRIHAAPAGDAYFPELPPETWQVVSQEHHEPGLRDDHAWSLIVLDRIDMAAAARSA